MNYVWKGIIAALATMRKVPPETDDSFSQVRSP